jgi:hypothetical protein
MGRLRHRLSAGPNAVLGQIRALQASTFDHSLAAHPRAERAAQEMVLETSDYVEGVLAFFEKCVPHFSDRCCRSIGLIRDAWLPLVSEPCIELLGSVRQLNAMMIGTTCAAFRGRPPDLLIKSAHVARYGFLLPEQRHLF